MKNMYWPRLLGSVGGVEVLNGGERNWAWRRTWVRELVPRKPEVDRKLVQSCHLFQSFDEGKKKEDARERTLMVYLPHVEKVEEIPFYHPVVRAIAFLHEWHPSHEPAPSMVTKSADYTPSVDGSVNTSQTRSIFGTLSIHIVPFPETKLHHCRLDRTVGNILQVLYKHGHGNLQGYTKRVHHDQIIGQKRFQDEYTRLKSRFARSLCEGWAEVTDPRKHVFEDLGIAAFLICLWEDMYEVQSRDGDGGGAEDRRKNEILEQNREKNGGKTGKVRATFPGFVDIGCGNGVLVSILLQEGWEGWGFDARRRKSWTGFPEEVRIRLQERVLVPQILQRRGKQATNDGKTQKRAQDEEQPNFRMHLHDGMFPEGTFIISNHADELTGWTPLLARFSNSPFIAIPCCSHNLAGARFRAPIMGLKIQRTEHAGERQIEDGGEQPKSGSLKQAKGASKQTSAYASLCSYITNLTESMGYVPEKEMLRIPSTRNAAIVGRSHTSFGKDVEETILQLLEAELRMPLGQIADKWIDQANKIIQSKGNH